MDGVAIAEALDRCEARCAASWWHWFFLGQTAKPAERVINADPDARYRGDPDRMGPGNYADWRDAVRNAATVHAMCQDHRGTSRPARQRTATASSASRPSAASRRPTAPSTADGGH